MRINQTLGEYQLVFSAIDLVDAGTYTCQDGGGIGEAHAAWIAVLGLLMLHVRFTHHHRHRHHPHSSIETKKTKATLSVIHNHNH